jgi:hypothetical protein
MKPPSPLRDAVISIEEIRFIDARTATTLFGTGHAGGVIRLWRRP